MQRCRPAVPDETAAQYGAPTASARSASKRGPVGPERELPRAQHLEHELLVALVDPGSGEVDRARVARLLTRARVMLGTSSRHCAQRSLCAANRVEVRLLQLARDRADADLLVVDRAHRRHLGGGAAHEHLVGEVQVGADQVLLDHLVAEVGGDLDRPSRA